MIDLSEFFPSFKITQSLFGPSGEGKDTSNWSIDMDFIYVKISWE